MAVMFNIPTNQCFSATFNSISYDFSYHFGFGEQQGAPPGIFEVIKKVSRFNFRSARASNHQLQMVEDKMAK